MAEMDPGTFRFEHQSLLEPYDLYRCTHKQASVGLYEWDVTCDLGKVRKVYWVHLVSHFYPKTHFGTSAYEILYWVTDGTNPNQLESHSTSLWMHNSVSTNRMNLLEASLGVDQDLAYLKLYLLPPAPTP